MKLTCTRRDLSQGLAVVCRAVMQRPTLPVLASVLLEGSNGQLRLSATNLDIDITCCIEARVEQDGALAVPARAFSALVNKLPAGDITLSLQRKTILVVMTSRGQVSIAGETASDFPRPATPAGNEPEITIAAMLLKTMITRVVFAASDDEERRPVYTGVLMQAKDRQLTLVAYDGFRLTVHETALTDDVSLLASIIPARALRTLARILLAGEMVRVSVSPHLAQVWFRAGGITLHSRLIDGQFLYGCHSIPTDSTTRVVLDTQLFAAHIARAVLFARENANIVRFTIRSEGRLAIESWDDDVGRYTGTLDAEITGEEMQIIFNARQLADVCDVLAMPQIVLDLSGPRKPAVIRPVSQDGSPPGFTYVVSPMTINH